MAVDVSSRPRAGLARLLAELGTTLLDAVCGDVDKVGEVGAVVIHDPLDEPELPERALVLGVGLHAVEDVTRLLAHLGEHRAVGLVVRGPVAPDDRLTAASLAAGVPVLAFARGASWTHLAGMLGSLTAETDLDDAEAASFGGIRSGDLFAVANAIAALLDAPVTIEDRNSQLLAFSSRQEAVDPSRVQTILGRQVPAHYTRILEERGVFQAMYRSDRPIWVEPLPDSVDEQGPPQLGRAAIAVRAGDEILGAIWVVKAEPLTAAGNEALLEASKLVAMHMVWQRADADVERRLRAELLSTALEGGPGFREAIRRLGLKDEPAIVLALTLVDASTEHPHAQLAAERKRVADAFAMHLSAVHPRSAAGLVDEVAYGILPLTSSRPEAADRAVAVATEFVERVTSRLRPVVGVGPVAADSTGLARSRSGADRALRVLQSGTAAHQVVRLDDVHMEALLLELADLVPQGEIPSGPVARLTTYDADHQSYLVDTLRAWLDAFGDVTVAAASRYVHPNTFRYRLRRVAEVGQLDLDDPDARLAAMLQLRLVLMRSAPTD